MIIALVANTRLDSSEFHVEYDPPHTIELIKKSIESAGHTFIFIEASENFPQVLKNQKPDLVFNRAEGLRGDSRESHVPAVLEMLNIPYVGSNVLTTSVCLNKSWTKKILSYHKILTPQFLTAKSMKDVYSENISLNYPCILKPNEEGSSMGINLDNVVHNEQELEIKLDKMTKLYSQAILIEEFIEGREFSVGMLQDGADWQIFPILEIDFSKLPSEIGTVFGQHAKTLDAELDYCVIPANMNQELKTEIENISKRICQILDIKDFARLDFRLNAKSELYFLEINPLPGMDFDLPHDFSFYPLMAHHGGMSYSELISRLIGSAITRHKLEY